LVSLATLPSRPSHSIAKKIAIEARMNFSLIARIMEKNPENKPKVVSTLGKR
jgi:hypothetical protein